MNSPKTLLEFGPYRLDREKRQLSREGQSVPITAKAMEVLVLLSGRKGEVVSKRELMEALWPDCSVEEANLTQNVFLLRKALGETAQNPRYVLTAPGMGYRFVGTVREVERPREDGAPATPAPVQPPGTPVERETTARAKSIAIVAPLLLLAIATGFVVWQLHERRRPPQRHIVVAVLPFANLTGDSNEDYLSDGFTEEMITQLGALDPQRLRVIARTSSMYYRNSKEPLSKIGSDLRADYLLEGSIRRDGERVRITAQFIQTSDQTHLWARQYDRDLKDLFGLQDEIAREVADEVQLTLGGPRQVAAQRVPPATPEAHDLYLRGRYFWNKRTSQGFAHAVSYFQQAIAKDPSFARAYAGLADSYVLMGSYYLLLPEEALPKARAAALRALELDPSLAEAHTSLALIAENYDWDWQVAEKGYRRAIELDPNYATAHQWYAEYLSFLGRFQEALAESERARRLDPLSMIIAADHGAILYFAGQYGLAIAQLRGVIEMEPSFARAHGLLICSYAEDHRFADALAEIQAWRIVEHTDWPLAMEAYVYGRMGRQAEARQRLRKLPRQGLQAMTMLATVYSGIDDVDNAVSVLQQAYKERSNVVTALKVSHVYDPLRGDRRFQQLLHNVGLNQ